MATEWETIVPSSKPPANDGWETISKAPVNDGWETIGNPLQQAAPPQTTTANPFKGAAARASELAASGIEGIARIAEGSRDYLDDKLSFSGLSKEEIKSKQQLKPMFEWVDSLRSWGKEINYEPSTKLGDLSKNPLNAVPFIAERIVSSSPDMAAAFYAFPAYIGARTNEILNDRLKNDEKKIEDATVGDVATSFGAAVLEATLEKFATKSVLKGAGVTGKTKTARVAKETAFQSGTEGVEEAIGYLGGAAGTKKGVDTQQLIENTLEGAIVGGGLGATAQGAKELVNTKETKAREEQTKSDLARLEELNAKTNGTPDQIITDPETGKKVIVKGTQGEFFTPEEQQEYKALNAIYNPAPKDQKLNDLVTRFEAQGMAREEAENLAKEELAKEELGGENATDKLETGTDQSGVSVSNEPSETIGGAATTQPGELAGASATTEVSTDGTTTQPNTLVTPPVAPTASTTAKPAANVTAPTIKPYQQMRSGFGDEYFAFEDEKGNKYHINNAGDVEVQVAPEFREQVGNIPTVVFRNGDPRPGVLPSNKLPDFVPPELKTIFKNHIEGRGLDNKGVGLIKDAVQDIYAQRELTVNKETPQQQGAIDATETTETKPIEEAAKEEPTATNVAEGETNVVKEESVANTEVLDQAALDKDSDTKTQDELDEAAAQQQADGNVVVSKGKRGRPQKVLTPEEQAAKDAVRKQQQATGRDTIREADKLNKSIDQYDAVLADPTKFIEQFKTDEEAQIELNKLAYERRQALIKAHAISVGPNKNKTAGKRAKAVLAKVSQQERSDAQKAYELNTSKAERSERLVESTNGEDNKVFEKFKNAAQALSWIQKNGNDFERVLAERIKPFVAGYKFVVVDSHTDLPTKDLQNSMKGAVGLHHEASKTIYVMRDGGINNTVILHEAVHGATVSRISEYKRLLDAGKLDENSNLARSVRYLLDIMENAATEHAILKATGGLTPSMLQIPDIAFTNLKEFVAYGMTMPAMQKFLNSIDGRITGTHTKVRGGIFTDFVQTIRRMFGLSEGYKSAFQDLIIITDQLMLADINKAEAIPDTEAQAAKKTAANTAKVDKDLTKVEISNSATNVTNGIGDLINDAHSFTDTLKDDLNARFPAMENGFISKLLATMQTSDILRWKGDAIPGLKQVDELVQVMAAMRERGLAASSKLANTLEKFIIKNGSVVLSDAMHLARLKKVGVDSFYDSSGNLKTLDQVIKDDYVVKSYEKKIADPNIDATSTPGFKSQISIRSKNLKVVYDAWAKLGKQENGHDMYRDVRQFYKDNQTVVRKILDDQIDALPIDAAAKAKLLKSARLIREQARETAVDLDDPDGLTDVEFKPTEEDYFPLMRHGQYWLSIPKGPTGREFYMFDSGTERNKYLNKRAKELGIDPKATDTGIKSGDDITSLRQNFQGQSQMLQKMFADIDDIAVNPKYDSSAYPSPEAASTAFKEELKDQLYQTYLMTLPERSFRKQFLHAEKVTGFSADILRNFKVSATRFANQTSKLKYASEIEKAIQRSRDTLAGAPPLEGGKLELFVNEIALRAREDINPPEQGQIATRINQFAFLMLLTSAASAATQMASVPIMVMPTLNARYGYGAAASKLVKYSQIWKTMGVTNTEANGEITFTAPSVGASKMVKGDKRLEDAFRAATEKYNLFQLTNTSVITNNRKTPDSASTNKAFRTARTFFNGITGLFSTAERISREITFMMTFELEYGKNGNFDASVQKAVETTNDLLGRYDNMERPRMLRNAVGRTVGQFKMYAVIMTSWFTRNAYTMFRHALTTQESREAMHRLTGVLAMGGLFHGLVGMPLYSTICSTIDAVLDTFEDDEDKRKRRRYDPLTADSSNLRFRYQWLPENFGQIKIPGIDGRDHRLSEVLEKGAISSLTDINIGSRTSFDNMWWREAKPGKSYFETAQNLILANMGPGVSTGVNMVGAIDDFSNGKIERGLEKLVPAFFKGSLVAGRLATEGAETKKGDVILKPSEINELNIIAQILGFSPTRLARIQEHNFERMKEKTEGTNQRNNLLSRFNEAIHDQKKDPEQIKNILNKIREHNKRYPTPGLIIEGETIIRSVKSYEQRHGLTIRGYSTDKNLAPYDVRAIRQVTPLQ